MRNNFAKISILFLSIFIGIFIPVRVNAQFTGSPPLNESIQKISEYIASDQFAKLKNEYKAATVIDSIYSNALRLTGNNVSEALLALMFATLPYCEVPIKLPLKTGRVMIPLPTTSREVFKAKLKNLPGNIFFNSDRKSTDRDKLAHFFGNAFLSYNLSFFNISKFMSIFVELFENSFKVEGAIDFRDLQVNMLGETFGLALRNNGKLVPSQFLICYYFFYITFSN